MQVERITGSQLGPPHRFECDSCNGSASDGVRVKITVRIYWLCHSCREKLAGLLVMQGVVAKMGVPDGLMGDDTEAHNRTTVGPERRGDEG